MYTLQRYRNCRLTIVTKSRREDEEVKLKAVTKGDGRTTQHNITQHNTTLHNTTHDKTRQHMTRRDKKRKDEMREK